MAIPALVALIAGLWLLGMGTCGIIDFRADPPRGVIEGAIEFAKGLTAALAGLSVAMTAIARLI